MARQKKCAVCREPFTPSRPMQKVCSLPCSITLAEMQRIKKEAREHREAKKKAKTRAQWLKEAQAAFNAYIRARDANMPCISCGRYHEGQYHAGHYRTTKAAPELRFNELNVHKQCSACNTHLSGNIVEYRINLIKKIGIDRVEWLEGPHEPVKYSIENLTEIKEKYRKMVKDAC